MTPVAGRRAAGILLLCLVAYLGNGRLIPTDDAIPARYVPISLLRHGTFALDAFPDLFARGQPYYLQHVNGHYVSSYPVGAPLFALPFFLDAVRLDTDPAPAWLMAREKIAAASLVALSVVVLYAALLQLTSESAALWLAAVYAFGSSSFSESSQALWQHGPAQLCLAGALYTACRARERTTWLAATGGFLAAAFVCRPPTALLSGGLVAGVLAIAPRDRWRLAVGAAVPLAFQVWYNQHYFGSWHHMQFAVADTRTWPTPFSQGLAGILASPSRGLLVYSPVFVGALGGAAVAWRRDGYGLYRGLSCGVAASLCLYAKWGMWWGGAAYGPRLLADLTPMLTVLLVPVVPFVMARPLRGGVAAALVAWSTGAHGVGAYCGDISWNVRVDVDAHPERLWSWRDNQPSECLTTLLSDVAGR